MKLLLHKLSLFLKYILIFFLNHINSYTATHTKTNVPVPNSVSISTKVDVHVSWSYPQNIFDDRKKDFRFTAFFLNSKIDLLRAYFFFEHITTTVFASYQNPVYLSDILWGWINVKIFELKRKKRKIVLFCCRYLGVSSITAPRDNICNNFPGLVDQQKSLCLQNPQALRGVKEGAKKAIYECQAQFSSERWNCTLSSNYSVFGHVLKKGRYCYIFF